MPHFYFHRENFVYTLNPPLLGADPVDEFLFDTRRGFCEHYAAAFVTLMRAAGIPSRVVVGYLGGELNTAGHYLIVRQSDAHAWAEIWLRDRGWVRVDPTGAIAPERIELGLDAVRRLEQQGLALGGLSAEVLARALELGWFEHVALRARWYWDLTNMTWYRWVVDYGKERQERFLASLGLDDIPWNGMIGLLFFAVLLVLDDTAGGGTPAEVLKHLPPNLPRTIIRNKIDLTGRAPGVASKPGGVEIALSAKTGNGLEALRRHLQECLGFQPVGEGGFVARRRHLDAIRRAQEHLARGRARLRQSRAGELLAEELRLSQRALGEITGEFTPDDLLGRIFSSFCIGK